MYMIILYTCICSICSYLWFYMNLFDSYHARTKQFNAGTYLHTECSRGLDFPSCTGCAVYQCVLPAAVPLPGSPANLSLPASLLLWWLPGKGAPWMGWLAWWTAWRLWSNYWLGGLVSSDKFIEVQVSTLWLNPCLAFNRHAQLSSLKYEYYKS